MKSVFKALLILGVIGSAMTIGCSIMVRRYVDHAVSKPTEVDSKSTKAEHEPSKDIEIVDFKWQTGGFGAIAKLSATLKNKGSVAYADIGYRAIYFGNSGGRISSHEDVLYEVLKPGETRTFKEIPGGIISPQTTQASLTIRRGLARIVTP